MSYKIPLGFKFLLDCFGDKLVQEYYDYCKNVLGFTNDEEVKSFALGYISIGEEQAKIIAEYSNKPISYWLGYQKEYDLRNRRIL